MDVDFIESWVFKRSSVPLEEQNKALERASIQCANIIRNDNVSKSHCPAVWDGVACWPSTPAGTLASQPCPAFVDGFYHHGEVTRFCQNDGTWFVHPVFNKSWSNYSGCMENEEAVQNTDSIFHKHLPHLTVLYNIGYGVSLVTLAVASIIMLYFRRLHCPRNTVHLNLFLSFMMRASLSFIKDSVLVEGLGLPEDVLRLESGALVFRQEGTHWRCKLLMTVFHYLLGANYIWVFVEGLYLHTVIVVAVFTERTRVRWYILLGWGGPLLFMIPWIIVRATLEDVLCWNTNPTPGYFWIMQGPIVLSIVVNFGFFLNVTRVLFTKLVRTSPPRARRCRYRRLAKSTLVLIPLFGCHYMLFLWLPKDVAPTLEVIKLYYEMFFNSFQGFFVSCLYCFLNSEVRSEMRKLWIRHKLRVNSRKFQKMYRQTSLSQVGGRNSPALCGNDPGLCYGCPNNDDSSSSSSGHRRCVKFNNYANGTRKPYTQNTPPDTAMPGSRKPIFRDCREDRNGIPAQDLVRKSIFRDYREERNGAAYSDRNAFGDNATPIVRKSIFRDCREDRNRGAAASERFGIVRRMSPERDMEYAMDFIPMLRLKHSDIRSSRE